MRSDKIPNTLPTQFPNRLENHRKAHKCIRTSRNSFAKITLPNIVKIDFLHTEVLTSQRFESVVSKLCPKVRAFAGGPDVGGGEAKDSIPHI